MSIAFDPEKDESNKAKHGLYLSDFSGFEEPVAVLEDNRRDYGERRFRGFGRIDGEAYSIAFTETGNGIRRISFRRAHEKEMRNYE